MKSKIVALLKKIKSRLSAKIIWWATLLILTFFCIKIISSFYSSSDDDKKSSTDLAPTGDAPHILSQLFRLKESDNLFSVGLPPVKNTLCINTRDQKLIYKATPEDHQTVIEYENGNSIIKKVEKGFEPAFDSLIKDKFQISDYSALLGKGNNISNEEITTIGTAIGASNDYVQKVISNGRSDIRTILFSLIYNTVLSGPSGSIVASIENKKMKIVSTKNYTIDIVNEMELAEVASRLLTDPDGEKTNFIEQEYNKIHPKAETNGEVLSKSDLQGNINKLVGKNVIRLNSSIPVDFAYINFKEDKFYCGDHTYRYDPNTLFPRADAELNILFGEQFLVSNYNNIPPEEISKRIGIPEPLNGNFDFQSLIKSNSELAFKNLLTFLLSNPEPHFVANGKLQSLSNLKLDSILYGKFDLSLLQKGLENISQDYRPENSFAIVKKSHNKLNIIYITLIMLFVSFSVMLYLFYRKQTASDKGGIIPTDSIDEQLIKQKEKYDALLIAKRGETIEEITKYLTKPGNDLYDETQKLREIKHKMAFYDSIEKCKNLTIVIKTIGEERKSNAKMPKLQSANDIFEEASREISNTEKITFLLSKFDEHLSQVTNEKQGLVDKFLNYKKAKQGNDKLNSLLAENYQGNFYDYLKNEIARLETNSSIESFVRFGLLFKSSKENKFKSEAEILNVFSSTNSYIDTFYKKCQRIDDPKLLERTAFLCWSLELANNLLQIRNIPILLDIEKVKQDQLQLISTRYFIHIAKNQSKTVADFELSILEGKERIADYNSKIADSISELKTDIEYSENITVLKESIRKIKKYESTELVLNKLYQHFIQEFNSKIESLRFTKEDLNAEDRSWLFQHLFNIAFHIADYTEYFIKNDDEMYHSNVQFLKNDFNLSKTEHRPFVENDREKSNNLSNSVVKAARFAGVKRLDLLLNKYYINSDQLI